MTDKEWVYKASNGQSFNCSISFEHEEDNIKAWHEVDKQHVSISPYCRNVRSLEQFIEIMLRIGHFPKYGESILGLNGAGNWFPEEIAELYKNLRFSMFLADLCGGEPPRPPLNSLDKQKT